MSDCEKNGQQDQSQERKMAKFYHRFLARMIDINLIGALFHLLFFIVLYLFFQEHYVLLVKDERNLYLVSITLLPLILAVECSLYLIFGNTPGKSLLGIKVLTSNGGEPTKGQYALRTLSVYYKGLFFGIPLLSFFSMIYQLYCLLEYGSTTYDKGKFIVDGEKTALWRTLLGVILFLFLFFISFIINDISYRLV